MKDSYNQNTSNDPERMKYHEYVELSSVEEYKKFRILGKIKKGSLEYKITLREIQDSRDSLQWEDNDPNSNSQYK